MTEKRLGEYLLRIHNARTFDECIAVLKELAEEAKGERDADIVE